MKAEKPNPKRTALIEKMIKLSKQKQLAVYDAFPGGKITFWRKRKSNTFTAEDEKNIEILLGGNELLKSEMRTKQETRKRLRALLKQI